MDGPLYQIQVIHQGRNHIYSFHHLFGLPQGPRGCQKMHHSPLNLDLEVWCSNIEPKLNELQKNLQKSSKMTDFLQKLLVSSILAEYQHNKLPNSGYLGSAGSFDTHYILGSIQLVEISQFLQLNVKYFNGGATQQFFS